MECVKQDSDLFCDLQGLLIPEFSLHFCWVLYLWLIDDFLSFVHFYRKFHSTWMTS